jgi:Type II secretion system (T2SS), protein E, N-terminal domain
MTSDRPIAAAARGIEVYPRGGEMHDVPLGTLVFRSGLMAQAEIEDALREAVHAGRRLGEVLVERGLHEVELARLLAAQNAQPFVDLDTVEVDPDTPGLLAPTVARIYCAFPFGREGGRLLVAVPDPDEAGLQDRLSQAMHSDARLFAASRTQIKRAIDGIMGERADEAPARRNRYEVVATLENGVGVVIDRMSLRSAAEALAERVSDDALAGVPIQTRDGVIEAAQIASIEIMESDA